MLTATKVERDQIHVAQFQNRFRIYTIQGFEPTRVDIVKPTRASRRAQIFLLRPGTRKTRRSLAKEKHRNLRKTSADRFPSDVPPTFRLIDRLLIQPEPAAPAFWERA